MALPSGLSGALRPTGKIAPQDWMTRPQTRAVMAALSAGGAEVRFVGGCVRDAVAGRPVKDVDIATPDPPDRVTELLKDAGLKAIPTGIKHGTVTAVADGIPFEITTLRIDVETDGRHARVAFTDDWQADAARRDFTINTLSATLDGDVYDPFRGLDDLANGRVRFVGVARDRIEEDILRLLRFFRIHAAFGTPPVDAEALAACRQMASRLVELSAERVRNELLRILEGPDPAEIMGLMRGERILESILPEAADIGRLRMMAWLETRGLNLEKVTADPIRRLAAVLGEEVDGGAVARRLRLSNRQTARLVAMSVSAKPGPKPKSKPKSGSKPGPKPKPGPGPKSEPPIGPHMSDDERRRALHRHGADAVRDRALLAWAAERALEARPAAGRSDAWMGLMSALDAWTPVDFPLRGRDVTALGLAAGPQVGAFLAQVESWWEDGGCRAGRDVCLDRLKTLFKGAS